MHQKTQTWLLWALLPVMFALGLGTGWLIWGQAPAAQAVTQVAVAATDVPQIEIPTDIKRYDIPLDDDPILGPADAPITIVEFSDYQCPYCSKWHQEVFKKLLETYKGQIRFVYRDFPLKSIHPDAVPAAEAANCAGEQNAYWEYHDALFSNKYGFGEQAYLQYATELGLNTEQFKTCFDERRYSDEVEADFQYAAQFGVSSTPTFFINGLAVVGAQPYELFTQLIDAELAGKIPK